jgi:hypothetical protein
MTKTLFLQGRRFSQSLWQGHNLNVEEYSGRAAMPSRKADNRSLRECTGQAVMR